MDGQGNFGDQQIITNQAEGARGVHAADVDGDGDMDVLSASRYDDTIAWYENSDGQADFGDQRIITNQAEGAQDVHAADFDADGDVDVVSASAVDGTIAWYANDGQGVFGDQQVITTEAGFATSVRAADLDGDGDMDVLSTSYWSGKTAWNENADGQGSFGNQHVIASQPIGGWGVHAADLDGDGDLEVLTAFAFDDTIGWYENTNGQGNFGNQQMITNRANGARDVYATDLDGDGDLDVISASSGIYPSFDGKIAWYENRDGLGAFGDQEIVSTQAERTRSIYAADLNGDGDTDILSASGNTITWYDNTDGQGNFGNQRIITNQTRGAQDVHAIDVDGDGDMDVLSASRYDDTIAWYENTDGQGSFGDQQIITDRVDSVRDVHAADLDGDGDMDVLSMSGRNILWYENTDGEGSFSHGRTIVFQDVRPTSVYAVDLDGDDDMDVISGAYDGNEIVWYKNTDGRWSFGDEQVITDRANGAQYVYAADMDGDGDMDVLMASSNWNEYSNTRIAWYENKDGQGDFGREHVITNQANGARSVYTVDLDGDGDMDVLSASFYDGRIAWYEQRLVGDANDDGVFDSSDLVQVFQSSEYEDRGRYNSTYEEGDWDGDGDFTSADLVLAFQAGVYERPAVDGEVATAVDWLFARDQRDARERAYVA